MKRKLSLITAGVFITLVGFGQTLDVDLVANTHNGGYHITCFGASDGTITSVVTGGTAPYTYQWSSGQTTADLTNVRTGNYSLTVTDSLGAAFTASITLTQPNKLEVELDPTELAGGTHISANGASDGMITTNVSGGTPPYTYLWNDGSTAAIRKYIPAGTYTVTISDANACTIGSSTTLVQPDELTVSLNASMHGGSWNLTCAGSDDGTIDATVSGGIPPYTYDWSHGAFTEDVSELRAGAYTVIVTDANRVARQATVTLTMPDEVDVSVTQQEYPNGFNVSCHDCFNGSAALSSTGGAGAYTYTWEDGNTDATRNDLGLETYRVDITDANGCVKQKTLELLVPMRDDWTMTGNEIQPQQFIGSTNEADVEFRAFNQPQLRLGADGVTELLGGVKMNGIGAANSDDQLLFIGQNGGVASGGGFPTLWADQLLDGCNKITSAGVTIPSWTSGPNKLFVECDLVNVGIGTAEPAYKLDVLGTISGEDLRLDNGFSNLTIGANGVLQTGPWSGIDDEAELTFGDVNQRIKGVHSKGLVFSTWTDPNTLPEDEFEAMRIAPGGNVGIKLPLTYDPTYALEVGGLIRATEVIVETPWWDVVFKEDYPLRTLEEVEVFIQENGHLPDVPSAQDVEENGASLGENVGTLLRKVEELTLYMIDLKKENKSLQLQVQNLMLSK
jgi:hypothetical protein